MSGKFAHMAKSHFKLAGKIPMERSTHESDYQPYNVNPTVLDDDTRKNLKRSHFEMGDRTLKTNNTEMQDSFKPISEVQQLVEASHNKPGSICVGNDQANWTSTMDSDFIKRGPIQHVEKSMKSSKTNFELGHDKPSITTTTLDNYKKYSQSDFPQIVNGQMKSGIKIAEQSDTNYVSEIRANFQVIDVPKTQQVQKGNQSSIKIADGISQYPSSATQEMLCQTAKIENAAAKAFPAERAKNIALGDDKFHGSSETRNQFKPIDFQYRGETKPPQSNTQEHVCYPEKENPKLSETQEKFRNWDEQYEKAVGQRSTKTTDPNCQKLSLDVSDYKTTTELDYQPTKLDDAVGAAENKRKHTAKHLFTEKMPNQPYQSATQAQMAVSLQAEKEYEKTSIVRQGRNNIQLGHDFKLPVTEMNQSYVPRTAACQIVDQTQLNNLRKSHYSLGNDKIEYISETQANIVPYVNVKEEDIRARVDTQAVWL